MRSRPQPHKPAMLSRAALFLALSLAASPALADGGGLESYLGKAQPQATWSKASHEVEDGIDIVCLEVTSQVWRGITWKHKVWLFRAAEGPAPDLSLLIVTGGSARRERKLGAELVRKAGGAIAVIDSVPNQPLFDGLREDALIAHTFLQYVKSGEADWPLLLPMTRAAIAAMDAIQGYSKEAWPQEISRFVVTGGSKRGWTTWLTGISDDRVAGIAPIVYDNLNLGEQMVHQLRHWGAYSLQIADYTLRGLPNFQHTETGRSLAAIVDPYAYRDTPRFKALPKLLINATNDDYWPVDALNLYWDEMGPKSSIVYVPNEGHGIRDPKRVVSAIAAFVQRIAARKDMPELSWTIEDKGPRSVITVSPGERPTKVRLWTAAVEGGRDFRKARWDATEVEGTAAGRFIAEARRPEVGAKAFFVEVEYGEGEAAFTLSTQITILAPRRARLY